MTTTTVIINDDKDGFFFQLYLLSNLLDQQAAKCVIHFRLTTWVPWAATAPQKMFAALWQHLLPIPCGASFLSEAAETLQKKRLGQWQCAEWWKVRKLKLLRHIDHRGETWCANVHVHASKMEDRRSEAQTRCHFSHLTLIFRLEIDV